jgi:hypothetical protein
LKKLLKEIKLWIYKLLKIYSISIFLSKNNVKKKIPKNRENFEIQLVRTIKEKGGLLKIIIIYNLIKCINHDAYNSL